ncbi:MAG: hypothetical protein EBR09_16600, partial [Proteobacteria bacterium]|nr:hypothetical protein [Pseudomonadota bacterium]
WTAVTPLSTEVSSGDKLRWQAAANAFGTLPAFTVSARDAGGSASGNLQVNVEIASVNDIPTLSTVSTLTGATEDTFHEITYDTLAGAADEGDIETAAPSFRIESVTAGTTLQKWSGSAWTAVTAGSTLLSSTEKLQWKAAAHAFGVLPAFTIKATDGTAVSVGTVQVNVDVASSNDIPTLITVNTLNGAVEDTFFTITYDTLAAAANESDVETALPSFRIENITAGTTLQKSDGIGGWNNAVAGITLLSAGDTLQWKAALNANGVLPAFTVTAYDGTNASSTPVTVSVSVAAVNDIPTLSAITTLTSATEDTFKEITYGELAGAADEADVDSAAISFRIESITAGTTLEKFNGTAWMPATAGFTVLSSGEKLQWKGAANTNGLLTAFAVKAYDGTDLSTTAVPVLVDVGIINDTPTLTSVATLTGAVEDTFREITYSELFGASNAYDVETNPPYFLIDTVSASTTLQKWDSTTSLWLPAVSGTTLLSSGEKLQWKAAAHANGVLPAFTVKAQDAGGLLSPAVQVSVSVNPVNDVPTLTTVSTLTGATEDNFLVIPYATLAAASNIADVETPLPSFRIEGVTASTTLEKWSGSTWNAVSAGSTLLSSGESLRWKAAANDSGTLNAFTVIATDATDLSTPAVQVSVSVAAVNDIPTLTSINSLNGATEDTFFEINYATLLSAADESDVETNPLTFRVESITSGTLQKWTGSAWINATAGYTTLATGEKLQWQGDTNANGMLNAFTVKVTDGTDYSSTAVPVLINVAAVNDTPTMTTLATLTGGLEDTPREITYGELADAANETDVENPALTFRIESVTGSTTLEKWTGSSWTAVTPLSTEVSSGDKLRWQAAANAFGTLPAFT